MTLVAGSEARLEWSGKSPVEVGGDNWRPRADGF